LGVADCPIVRPQSRRRDRTRRMRVAGVAVTPTWLQLWLQLAAFAPVLRCPSSYEPARQSAYGTAMNRHERDHDGLAVWVLNSGASGSSTKCEWTCPLRSRPSRRCSAARVAVCVQIPVAVITLAPSCSWVVNAAVSRHRCPSMAAAGRHSASSVVHGRRSASRGGRGGARSPGPAARGWPVDATATPPATRS
jgi:hypothetical protein